ncbi:uncharacterized protein TNIN_169741 [Trichonephila inaurata madagascariensis]|uniref:Uncharacterized protein n=1 Tax=Trichonephila inaurata madagascariensis TaxID=2747483 RepID=A0A8X7CPZ4_9ARAC|nr:uncharacterized protein TNIN_169741 [Trichonephila inaurata madagascariensis]
MLLVDMLYSLGFAASYGKTVQYEISTAYHPQSRILSSESGMLVEYVGDNANINVHTLDSNNTLHVMEIVTPKYIHWPYTKMYNQTKRVSNSIDNLRYTQFIKSTKLNKPVQLFNIPPTSAAVHQHISRVYYQVQTWLGNRLEPQEWGSILRKEFLEPITTILPPTPDELLKTICCNCKNGCGLRCGCKKSGCNVLQIVTSIIGQACFNASHYESDLDEDCTFDPKIFQDLETNILDDENNGNE